MSKNPKKIVRPPLDTAEWYPNLKLDRQAVWDKIGCFWSSDLGDMMASHNVWVAIFSEAFELDSAENHRDRCIFMSRLQLIHLLFFWRPLRTRDPRGTPQSYPGRLRGSVLEPNLFRGRLIFSRAWTQFSINSLENKRKIYRIHGK